MAGVIPKYKTEWGQHVTVRWEIAWCRVHFGLYYQNSGVSSYVKVGASNNLYDMLLLCKCTHYDH